MDVVCTCYSHPMLLFTGLVVLPLMSGPPVSGHSAYSCISQEVESLSLHTGVLHAANDLNFSTFPE